MFEFLWKRGGSDKVRQELVTLYRDLDLLKELASVMPSDDVKSVYDLQGVMMHKIVTLSEEVKLKVEKLEMEAKALNERERMKHVAFFILHGDLHVSDLLRKEPLAEVKGLKGLRTCFAVAIDEFCTVRSDNWEFGKQWYVNHYRFSQKLEKLSTTVVDVRGTRIECKLAGDIRVLLESDSCFNYLRGFTVQGRDGFRIPTGKTGDRRRDRYIGSFGHLWETIAFCCLDTQGCELEQTGIIEGDVLLCKV
eukprot:TRINITY_DN12542_c0_g1_i1.p1 TRINITY_DN12542_c0_g1~~TRINITY_DN12542_c0_g1_i1.p1  ORF type:complete len:250 (-),score=15.84 TRINITY_DN12542_c0_g1_i1:147-896(-)